MSLQIKHREKCQLIYFHDIPDDLKTDFDYDNAEDSTFVKYRDRYYDINDFMRFSEPRLGVNKEFEGYDAYASDSFFSGVVIRLKLDEDDCDFYGNDYVIMATYLS